MDRAESSRNFFKRSDLMDCFPRLLDYKKKENLCDVTLKVEDQEIHAHRIILSMTIPYFEVMFLSSFRESSERTIKMHGIDANILEDLISLSYGAEIEVTSENVLKLLVGADYLLMNQVKTELKDYLKAHLTPENAWQTKIAGDLLNCEELVDAAAEFLDENFVDFSKTNVFLELESEEVISVIRRPELAVSEEKVYEAVMKWVKFSVFDRTSFLPQMLSNVRMCLLSPEYIVDIVRSEILIKTSSECKELLEEAMC